jgi:20S proteasome alpha/beta subunit
MQTMEGEIPGLWELIVNAPIFFDSTILAIAGDDFSVIASDLRLSEGFQIYSRDSSKAYQL